MHTFRKSFVGIALGTALITGSLLTAPAANAAGQSSPRAAPVGATDPGAVTQFTPDQIDQAIDEAKAGGFVEKQTTGVTGDVTTTFDLGGGFTFDLVQDAPEARLGAGRDNKGTFVSFNSTDQNAIISGALFGIGAALCAVSAGTFCVVAGAILTAAGVAITANGGVRCSGGKALRVYPFAGGKVKPRCV